MLKNHFRRTLCRAFAAIGALAVVDYRHIVIHMDGIELTLLGTKRTGNTAVVALGLHILALIMGGAL